MSQDGPRPPEPGDEAVEHASEIIDDVTAPEDGPARGIRALAAEQFSIAEAIGGVRGLLESLAPGLVFVVVFVATQNLTWSLIGSMAVAVIAVVVRLLQRTPVTQALGGVLGVVIGVVWAWRSGDGRDYFAWGLWTNAAYLAAMVLSMAARWPLVGVVVEALRSGWGIGASPDPTATASQEDAEPEPEPDTITDHDAPAAHEVPMSESASTSESARPSWTAWRKDYVLFRRYMIATCLWVGLFGLRLLVQVPLYFEDEVGWLGTARLVMGLPLWAAVLWFTWVLVRRRTPAVQ